MFVSCVNAENLCEMAFQFALLQTVQCRTYTPSVLRFGDHEGHWIPGALRASLTCPFGFLIRSGVSCLKLTALYDFKLFQSRYISGSQSSPSVCGLRSTPGAMVGGRPAIAFINKRAKKQNEE